MRSWGRFAAVLTAVAALTACGKVATDDSVEEQISEKSSLASAVTTVRSIQSL